MPGALSLALSRAFCPAREWRCAGWCGLASAARAEDASPAKLLAQGDVLSQKHESRAALQVYLQAEKLFPTNAEVQIKMAEAYMCLMHGTKSKAEQKKLAAQALACGQKAAADDAQSAGRTCAWPSATPRVFPTWTIKRR